VTVVENKQSAKFPETICCALHPGDVQVAEPDDSIAVGGRVIIPCRQDRRASSRYDRPVVKWYKLDGSSKIPLYTYDGRYQRRTEVCFWTICVYFSPFALRKPSFKFFTLFVGQPELTFL